MAAITICTDFGAQENEVSHCFHCFPIYFPWSDGTRCHDLSFLNVVKAPISWYFCRYHHPYTRKWRGTKKPLNESERGEWKSWLKLNIQKTKIMVSGSITSWEINGETVETVPDFIFGDSKITADGDCSHEIKRRLLLGRKVMTNLDSILKTETLLCRQRSF